jgi:hypothetical protein
VPPCSCRTGSSRPCPAPPRSRLQALGCSICGTHTSSSFRNVPSTNDRLCNSCHCKSYRLKRKAAGLTSEAALARLRAKQAAPASRGRPAPSRGPAPQAAARPRQRAASDWLPLLGQSPFGAAAPASAPAKLPCISAPGGGRAQLQRQPHDGPGTPHVEDGSRGSPDSSQQGAAGGEPSGGGGRQSGQPQHAPPPLPPAAARLLQLQRCVLEEGCGDAGRAALLLHCAGRAQRATPEPAQR